VVRGLAEMGRLIALLAGIFMQLIDRETWLSVLAPGPVEKHAPKGRL